jgi:hypothetical protein
MPCTEVQGSTSDQGSGIGMTGTEHLRAGWIKFREEIESVLRETDPEYRKRIYIKPVYWIDPIRENPDKFPLLSRLTPRLQKRYMSYFLKDQGRVARSQTLNATVWMIPDGS